MRKEDNDATRPDGARLLDALTRRLREASPLALAFSGGLDSRFLAHMAARLAKDGVRAWLFHIQGPHVPAAESAEASAWAREHGLGLTLIDLDPLRIPQVRTNDMLRCYHCKRYLFMALREAALAHPAFAGETPVLCDGSNLSDRDSYRPGLRALEELGVRSPLAEVGLTKEAIRGLAAQTGLDRPDQQARPCLLTRFAYGLSPTARALAALEAAEAAIAALLAAECASVPEFRLRFVAEAEHAMPSNASSPLADAFCLELHLGAEPPERLKQQLIAAVVAQGLAHPRLVTLERISGHYDRR